ncbi:MAG: VOC family protein [Alphaproteobacteria bacterium]
MSATAAPAPSAVPKITGVHHTAFRCRDATETRWFYEEVMGLPLAAALAFDKDPGTGAPMHYMHLFFEMGDGRFVAFFDLPDSATEDRFKKKNGFNLHIAFEVDTLEQMKAFKQRFDQYGIECHGPIDHGFVESIYAWDPNGIQVEVTARAAKYDAIMADEQSHVDAAMKKWDQDTRHIKVPKLKLRAAG